MAKDYYALLGVDRSANPDELKKAFRKKALEHHPDRAEDKAAAEAKFKEINEAYAVLSDTNKRRQYDTFGAEGFGQRFSQEDIFSNFNFGSIQDILGDLGGGDIFSKIFSGGGGGRGHSPFGGRGGPFRGGFGGGPGGFGAGGPAGFGGTSAPARGSDAESEITIPFEEAVRGGERQISLAQAGGAPRSLKVKIPSGFQDGAKLRLKGQGGAAPGGGRAGDLYLRVRVAPHARLRRRDERDLEVDVEIGLVDLVLGSSVEVPTLSDGDKRVKVKAGSQPGSAIRLRGFGAPAGGGRAAGDLYAILQVRVPGQLSDEQRDLFEQLRESGL